MTTPEQHDQAAAVLENVAAALRKDGAIFAGDNLSPSLAAIVASEIDTLVTLHRDAAVEGHAARAKMLASEEAQLREAAALRRDDHHVNPRYVLCAYDHCMETLEKSGDEHPWKTAVQHGWRLAWPSTPLATDLYCPDEHDERGWNKKYL